MKKLLLIVALFVGVPSFAFADIGGCILGGVGVGAVGSQIGGGSVPKILTVLGAIAGCNMGSRIEDGTYGQPTEEVVVVNQPSYPPQYGGGYGVGVVCDTTPKQGMAPPRPGMCNNPYNGGEISYEALQREAARREGYQYAQPPVYNQQRRSSSVRRAIYSQEESRGDMWDRPEKQRVAGVAAVKRSPRLTVDNYLQPGAVNSQCQTGNWGVDSNCLNAFSSKLAELQERCERGEKNSDCRKNPGVIAGEYRTLAAALRSHQDRMQAGGGY